MRQLVEPRTEFLDRVLDLSSMGWASELRYWLGGCGMSPKWQQDRRWVAPKAEDTAHVAETPRSGDGRLTADDLYARLRIIES